MYGQTSEGLLCRDGSRILKLVFGTYEYVVDVTLQLLLSMQGSEGNYC